ncbi:hypothetical protein LTR78_010778 [Recurvomyces mirabilis]|uniref:N-acetyltransferase domain-containing protein n=1 Tax=Recurvomyces mirabilis TaxID=574656 RepID=A0AAE0WHU2_9PEZI|nr:hypothetical protein LTR78_010778 [Recurvomyces mirabilis]KAK5162357.1 hypothetical protein LTS14_000704 [Recurvomyces mirabilis]
MAELRQDTVQDTPWRSARLTYRAIEAEDEAFVHDLVSEPQSYINSQIGVKKPQGRRDSKKFYDFLINECLLGMVVCVTAEADKPFGLRVRSKLVAFASRQRLWVGGDTVGSTLGLSKAGLHRVTVKAFEYNEGARRLYERLGFTHEGTIRETSWYDGRWWADYEYGMIESEWGAKQPVQKALLKAMQP